LSEQPEGQVRKTLSQRIANGFFYALTSLLCRIEGSQLSRVPSRGPLILVSNHVNVLEIPVLYTRLWPRPISGFFAAYRLESPWMRWLLRTFGGIPVHRGEPDLRAIRQAIARIRAGDIFALAPEGTRSGDGRLGPGRPGVVMLALQTGAPILPVVHYGDAGWLENLRRLRRTPFHIAVGRPFRLKPMNLQLRRAERERMVDEIMYQMAALLPPEYRGVYADLSAATTRYLCFLEGPE